jgi:hypothetical protein
VRVGVVPEVRQVAGQVEAFGARLAVQDPAVNGVLVEPPRQESAEDERRRGGQRQSPAAEGGEVHQGQHEDIKDERFVELKLVDLKVALSPRLPDSIHVYTRPAFYVVKMKDGSPLTEFDEGRS